MASSHRRLAAALASTAAALAFAAAPALAAPANTTFAADPYSTGTAGQFSTEVEPDTFAYGGTEFSAYQVGRITDGGAANVGFARTTNGSTWTSGFLTGVTKIAGGSYDRATDASVAYDARDHTWFISSLVLTAKHRQVKGAAVLVSRSTDGGSTWTAPVTVAAAGRGADFDKNWIVCDNNSTTSTHYGNCYVTFDDFGHGDKMKFSTSSDGGSSWSAPVNTGDSANGLGGQPLVQPNGNVVVPFANASVTSILSTRSTNGGASWDSSVVISPVSQHTVAANMRADALPTAEIDSAGKVYVAWQDCRFRTNCSSNDIVLSSSSDGATWSGVTGVPIDARTSTVDHFTPGLAVDPSTSGSSTHLGLAYYYLPNAACTTSTCQLGVGYISSTDGGSTWGSPDSSGGGESLASGMNATWLANTTQGYMAGDYISTSFVSGLAHPVYAIAGAPSGSTLNELMATPSTGLAASGGTASAFAASSAAPINGKNNPSVARSAGHRAQ